MSGEEPLVTLFSVTSASSGGQGLTGNSDKSPPLPYNGSMSSFQTLGDVIMSHIPCLSSQQDMMMSHNVAIATVIGGVW